MFVKTKHMAGLIPRTSIRKKLMVPLVAMVLFVFLLLAATQFWATKTRSEKEILDKLTTNSRLASLVYANALWNYNYDGMADIANAVMLDAEIGMVTVRTFSGREVYGKSKEGPEYQPQYVSRMEIPITYQNQPIGIVSVGVTTYYRQAALRQEVLQTILYLAGMIGAVVVAISRVARTVTSPIAELERSTEELAHGNLKRRIVIDSGDEIGRLAEKFNAMAGSLAEIIKERDDITEELLTANETLEVINGRQIDEIRERIAAQEALAASEEKYGKSFKNLAEVVGLARISDQRYVEVNDIFFKQLGYTPEEVIGHSSVDFELWDKDEDRRRFFDLLDRQGSVRNFECRWLTKDRELRIGLTSAEIITIAGERFEVFVWNDITERKQAEEALRIAHNQLELKVEERTSELMALNEELMAMNDELVSTLDRLKKTQQQLLHSEKMAALGGLVAGMSHEISTPIGIGVTSVSYVQKELAQVANKLRDGTLRKTELEEFISETMIFIQTTSKNLERADLLIRSFKQISVDQTTEDKRRFKVKHYLEELLLSLNPLLRNKPHRVLIDCPESLELTSYPGALAQILTNFITNSLRHGFEGEFAGTIRIGMDRFGSLYTLTYRDDGKGMAAEVLEHIYDPFFTTKRGAEGGTGLGLHLVYNIVTQKLGGEIKCFSEPGAGVSFIITFPDLYGE